MKILLLLSLLISTPLMAIELDSIINILDNPLELPTAQCTTLEHPWCNNLEKSICSIKKTAVKQLEYFDKDLEKKYVTSLPKKASAVEISKGKFKAIEAAEAETIQRTKITFEEQAKLIEDVKKTMIAEIQKLGLAKNREDYMVKKVSDVYLQSASTLINDLQKQYQKNRSEANSLTEAVSYYTEACGSQGMESNAFFSEDENALILCPGIIQSASEFGTSKEDILTALSFTIGHEIGHSIDGRLYQDQMTINPEVFDQMKKCYIAETPSLNWPARSAEVISDFWVTVVMASSLKDEGKTAKEVFRSAAIAMDGLCAETGDEEHPAGSFRMNKILSRNPQMRELLECAPPTSHRGWASP